LDVAGGVNPGTQVDVFRKEPVGLHAVKRGMRRRVRFAIDGQGIPEFVKHVFEFTGLPWAVVGPVDRAEARAGRERLSGGWIFSRGHRMTRVGGGIYGRRRIWNFRFADRAELSFGVVKCEIKFERVF